MSRAHEEYAQKMRRIVGGVLNYLPLVAVKIHIWLNFYLLMML